MTSANILVVENEIIVAKDIQKRLEEFGYSVTSIAMSGEEAIKKIAEESPDLVLMDIRLEGDIDSVGVAQTICKNFDIPIIYLAENVDKSIIEHGKATPSGYIHKPFKEKELEIAVEIALSKHQMGKKLKQSEEWLATILQSIGDAVITSDALGTVTFMNHVAEALTGWNSQDAFGKEITEVFNISLADAQCLNEHPIKQALQVGVTVGIPKQSVLISREGTKIPIDDSVAPIKDDKGNIMGAVLIFRDITERKLAQATHQKQIEQERLLAQMEKLHELKDDFLSTVSHELRTPMSNMKLAIQMLKMAPNAERRQLYLEILQSECNREITLINELLDLQRLETSSYPILLNEAVNLKNWLPNIVDPFRVRTQENGQLLQTHLAPNLPQLITDRASLERIIAELLNNACKYTPAGCGIILNVRYVESEEAGVTRGPLWGLGGEGEIGRGGDGENLPQHLLTSSSSHDSPLTTSCTIFTISNQAEIPAAELPRIFEKFYRIASADRWKQGGTGLGLALVQKLVEHLQGTIQVESCEGWTTFTIGLPKTAR